MTISGSSYRYAVIGAGAWGTALAIALARGGIQPILWAREAQVISSIKSCRENKPFLPGIPLSSSIEVTDNLSFTLETADCCILAIGTQYLRGFLKANPLLSKRFLVITCKGIEQETGLFVPEILAQEISTTSWSLLSGPTFAYEVALGKPSVALLASHFYHTSPKTLEDDPHNVRHTDLIKKNLINVLTSTPFRLIPSDDVMGTAIGGALKNIFAIGAGLIDKLGPNAAATLLCHSLHEMQVLANLLGGNPQTLLGPAGLGDLVLTMQSSQSRNRKFGLALAQGNSPESILSSQALTEGVVTSQALQKRLNYLNRSNVCSEEKHPSKKQKIDCPHHRNNLLPLATHIHNIIASYSPQAVERLHQFLLNQMSCFSTLP